MQIRQVQINLPNGGHMIADNAWMKQINVNGQVQYELILNECKLSSASPWTTRQTELLDALNNGTNSFTLRSAKFGQAFPQGSVIKIKTVISTVGNGTATGGHTVTKVF